MEICATGKVESFKIQIKAAVEKLFDVKVEYVNTVNCHGKKKRMGRNEGYTPEITLSPTVSPTGARMYLFSPSAYARSAMCAERLGSY